MSTYKELLQTAHKILKENEIADAELDAWYLLAHVFRINRADFFMHENEEAPKDQTQHYKELITKRSSHLPLQYITGTQEFMGLEFEVDENVLIPRQDTELLVEEVLKVCKDKSVLDMCTGSGCIIISLSKLGSIKSAAAVDISQQALQVANRNAKKHNRDINFIQSDLFEKVMGNYDIIVSNPPYIRSEELLSLMPEVKDYEPKQALDAGPSGLIFYERIISDFDKYLNPGGYIFLELGYDQGEAVSGMLKKKGFIDIEIKKDFCDLDRLVYARKSSR